MEKQYDLIVIGTGSAGAGVAIACSKEDWKVAIIDSRAYGGTCALRGCDPKKVLVGAAEIIDWNERMRGKGVQDQPTINWADLMAFKETFVEDIPPAHEQKLKDAGVETFHGFASFINEDTVQVGDDQLKGKHILIATGAKPAPLSIEGEQYLGNSDDFLSLEQLPSTIVFVGGGYISMEFAHIAVRAGAEVHIIHHGEQPLSYFDPDLVDELMKRSREVGIQFHLNTEIQAIKQTAEHQYTVQAVQKSNKQEKSIQIECVLVIHGAGRVPNIDKLGLDQANIDSEKQGITVNEYLQSTSNPRVYAAGDVAATKGLPLTPIAGMESQAVRANLLQHNVQIPNYKVMPSIVFTIPKLASVGMTVEEAQKLGDHIKINDMDTSSWYTYKRTNEKHARIKVIIDTQARRVLGAHILSGEADDLINHFATAIQFDLNIDEWKKTIYGYPTAMSDLSYFLEE